MSTPEPPRPEPAKPARSAALRLASRPLPPLSRNPISAIGWGITLAMGSILAVLVAADMIFNFKNPYSSMVTYLVLPGILFGGVCLILLGIFVEWRRRHRATPGEYPWMPVINLNLEWQRRRVFVASVLLALFFGLSAVGTYQAYHFTESQVFCGQICHQVMKPEYTAYSHSPHAKVPCTECHIGAGASWYVKSKMSGLRQVYAVLTNTYRLPIETPVANLRPARETCEECHWPGKVSGSLERQVWHFSPDQSNTPMRYSLLLKVGGGAPEIGQSHGIHWHINEDVRVRYWARDRQRLDIPWVEVTLKDHPPKVFRSADCPDPLPGNAEIRLMDCIDCHNRPSHIYQSPRQLVDSSLSKGLLDSSLPYLKRYAMELLERDYPNTQGALEAIEKGLRSQYSSLAQGPRGAELVDRNIQWLQQLYQRNFFPEQRVDWREYPNHIGHFEFPGCYRCHDDKHTAVDGKVVSNRCELCHDLIDQAEGEKVYQPPVYQAGEFHHPLNMGDIWKTGNCTDCHGVKSRFNRDEPPGKEPAEKAKQTVSVR